MQYRSDIGGRSMDRPSSTPTNGAARQTTYADAGVDLDAGTLAVDMMKKEVRSTYGPEVLAGIGAFGGMYDASGFVDDAILVASTDGVGTKTKVATAMRRYDTVGIDIVNHCINNILVQGARPLFFLDYVATGDLDPTVVAAVVGGMARACRDAGCALLGGETAEMPGVYMPDELDVVGTIVGVVSRDEVIDGSRIGIGDAVLGIDSAGLHTNGFSLARKVFEHWDLTDRVAALGTTLGNALLAPHRSYLPHVTLLRKHDIDIRSLVHITNGGLVENPERVLPADMAMRLELSSWQVPPLFSLIRQQGNIAEHEMYRAFNMGIGMLVVVPHESTAAALSLLGDDARQVGSVVPRDQAAVELIC
jgi:phosphoribosylformylglycinamidine cyclo-ligase